MNFTKKTTQQRLEYLMKERNLKQVDILDKCKPYCHKFNVKMNKSDLSQYVSGKVEPSQSKLIILGMALNVSEAWLMGYDVPMGRNSTDLSNTENAKEELTINEFDLIKKYRELDDFGKRLINSAIDIEYDRCIDIEDKNTPSTIIKIPLADLSLSAGQGNFFLDASYDMIQVDGKKYPKADIAFRITGDSMEPRYFDGDIVYIHKQDIVNVGEIGAFLYNNNQYLKKLIQKKGIYYLHSLNPKYDDIEINNDTLITYGKVLN